MRKKSAGILLYRISNGFLEILLVHPGGPFWVKKDLESWSIPKGEFDEHEDAFETAKREFAEELGEPISGNFIPLDPIIQKSGKMVYAWAVEGNMDTGQIQSNTFEMEWPPKSGRLQSFPEIDKAEWFDVETAKKKINAMQVKLIDELVKKIPL